jgi:DNA-binding MarR family transcriptional regulator
VDASKDLGDLARRMIAFRRRREELLGKQAFGDPVWDMLLELFAAREEGKRISVSRLCVAARVPTSTALRWISAMESEGRLIREDDPADRRRVNVRLTPRSVRLMRQLLGSWSGPED